MESGCPYVRHVARRLLLRPLSQFQGQRLPETIAVDHPVHLYFHLLSGAEILLQQSGQIGDGRDVLTVDVNHDVARSYARPVGGPPTTVF